MNYTTSQTNPCLVQGPAYGGAIGLVACCQIAIVASHVTFCFSEVKLRINPRSH